MQTLNLVQGSPDWLAARTKYFTASEAPAMMGASPYKTRAQLLNEKATGITPDVSDAQQRIFNRGHEAEASARAAAELLLGESLYQATVTVEVDGLPLLASLDGHDLLMNFIFEHKLFNQGKHDAMAGSFELLPEYYWQVEHQLLVSGARLCHFVMSNGDINESLHIRYESDPERRAALIAGWKQFALDLSTHVPVAVTEKPEATPVADLPALFVDVEGHVKGTNLATFKQSAEALIKSVKTELVTDQDFADAELIVKKFGEAEKSLDDAKKQALAKTESIDEFFREVDHLKELFRQKRLELDKLVKAEKEARKRAIVSKAQAAMGEHYSEAERKVGFSFGSFVGDFAGVVKGKRSLQSMQEAVDQELANMKVAINQRKEKVLNNLAILEEVAGEFHFLFPDHCDLVRKDQPDMIATVKLRIAEHEAEQKRKAEEKAAAENKQSEQAPVQPAPAVHATAAIQKPRVRAGFNQHGLNTGYVAQRLQMILRDLNDYEPEDLAKLLVELADTIVEESEAA